MVCTERRAWSPDEAARAKELGGQMTVSQIAAEMGRPVSSVYSLLNTASQTALHHLPQDLRFRRPASPDVPVVQAAFHQSI